MPLLARTGSGFRADQNLFRSTSAEHLFRRTSTLPPKPSGLVAVLIEPGPNVTETELTDWYEGEHVPRRLTVPGFLSALWYRAIDSQSPSWLTLYDIETPEAANSSAYVALADLASDNEKGILSKIALSRRTYSSIRTFTPPSTSEADLPSRYILVVSFIMKSPEGEAELDKWYNGEHFEMLAKVPGYQQGARFLLLSHKERGDLIGKKVHKFFAFHSFSNKDFLGTPEFKAATSTEWRERVMAQCENREARVFELYKNLGA
ncbi:hypothetical protein MKEN_01079500 [Mycena kentingensis (nom. inval.)]|nr:hypothetical protein MKEN_01079500 [Mycena kentingensis (nom. inval.)]